MLHRLAWYVVLSIFCLVPHKIESHGFLRNTVVKTIDGYKGIGYLDRGTTIISYDPEQQTDFTEVITDTSDFLATPYCFIRIGQTCLLCHPAQLFWSCTRNGWVEARSLTAGDVLLTATGSIPVKSVTIRSFKEPYPFFTLTVPHHHVFCVTKHDIITHNLTPDLLLSGGLIGATIAGTATLPIALPIISAIGIAASIGALTWKLIKDRKKPVVPEEVKSPGNQVYAFHDSQSNDKQKERVRTRKNAPASLKANDGEGKKGSSPDPEKPDDDDEIKEEKEGDNKIEITKNDLFHMFKKKTGHFEHNTPENRKLLIELVKDMKNFLGTCENGVDWYGKLLSNGKQLWAAVRDKFLRNGGLNDLPREFNPKTGLCKSLPVK